jgi:hypothetical protein
MQYTGQFCYVKMVLAYPQLTASNRTVLRVSPVLLAQQTVFQISGRIVLL